MNESTFQRYFSGTESIYFVLVGAAWGQALQKIRGDRTELLVIGVSSLVLWMGIAWLHQFGAACLALGAVACAVMSVQVPPAIDDQRRYWVAAASLMMILGASLVWTEIANRSHLQTGAFENEVRNKLDADGQSSAMLVGPPYQLTLQAQTHHPVMSDMATHYHGSYMPSLAPSVHRMYHAVYGIDLTRPNGPQPGWQSVWAARSAREWAEVGQTYAFEYVVAPTPLNVDLELLIEGSPNSLYRIWPEATASSPPEPVGNGASDARREAQTTDPD